MAIYQYRAHIRVGYGHGVSAQEKTDICNQVQLVLNQLYQNGSNPSNSNLPDALNAKPIGRLWAFNHGLSCSTTGDNR